MLAEVIKTRPYFFLFGTVRSSTTKASIGAILGHDLMHALLVPIKIIVGTETINLGASRYLALERFFMSQQMLPNSLLLTTAAI